MPSNIDSLKPGQDIKLAIVKRPKNVAGIKTLERLMRMDPKTARGLRSAHRKRQQGLVVYNRGNRDWTKREECGKLVRVIAGQTWTMKMTADTARDLKNVADYIKIG